METRATGSFGKALKQASNWPYMPAVIVFVMVMLCAWFADSQKRHITQEYLRSSVTEQLSLIRARLEGKINGNVQLVQGLVAMMEMESSIDQDVFAQLTERILRNDTQIRHIAAAPDLVIRMIYPIKGNERLIGFDYRENLAQSGPALRVRDTGQLIITGPVKLIQGGTALIARYPVFVDTPLHEHKFWGLVSAVIDLDRLFRDVGLLAEDLPIDIALASNDAAGQYGVPFFGDAQTFQDRPVDMSVQLGRETWRMGAVPKGGWNQLPPDIWTFRLLIALVGVVVLAPMIWGGRLMSERQRNIVALQQRKDELKEISQRLEIAIKASKIGIWELDVKTNRLLWDERMHEIYDLPQDQANGDSSDWKNALHPEDTERSEQEFLLTFEGKNYEDEFRLLLKSGEVRHVRAIGVGYVNGDGDQKIIGVNWDVTNDILLQDELREAKRRAEQHNGELEEARRQMEYNSLHDALTHLPNRRFLDQLLSEKAANAAMRQPLTILHIDLDRFKEINDTLGHAAGDEILKHVAGLLTAHLPARDFVARIGGDEFVVVSEVPNESGYYETLSRQIIDAFSTPILFEGHECRAGASIGIASEGDGSERLEQLLVDADIALYEAKRKGRNRSEFFTDTLRSSVIHTKQTADEILRGLDANEFIAYFQPQFDAHTLEISGVEALVRWDHPGKGIMPPFSFLKIAESLNVVSRLDEIVLEQALLHFRQWAINDLDIPKVSVNISAQRLHDQNLFNRLSGLGIRPGSVCFELLESISFDEHDELLIGNIQKLKELGIDIEIDDFGTGHASIISLLKLTPRRLKIDRQLIRPILQSTTGRQLVESIIDIGQACGIEIVAEGVESMAHAALLRDLGCHHLQGYAFARPMSGPDFLDFARQRNWLKEWESSRPDLLKLPA
ncbi:EAL domain-containing protein [Rhizobium sp. LjRoot30]|uniref:bifunctional diguanylate cyclase/phosphodiesterase n=1 Tax=Rhizobium sp. LjRoot30 TaxID=3342320 RepID=UPI003ED11781